MPALLHRLLCTLALVAATAASGDTAGPRFFPDDPIWVDDDRAFDASGVRTLEDLNAYDFAVNTFTSPGERRDVRALNVNTVDEVPDSSWFTNRIGRRDLSVEDLVRGPDRVATLSLDGWVVIAGKSTGRQPGFRMLDPGGQLHQIEVDPSSNPEMASGAEIIGTAFYHAFGYHTVDVYLGEVDADALVIAEKATIRDPMNGTRRRLTRRDLDQVFRVAARQANGRYRVLVSRFADGRPAGNFRYYDTRPDDPNDIVPHEHRRELRGARVFGAWLNHDDSRGINSLDMIETFEGRSVLKHYMFDFGSILGSGTVFEQRHRSGNEYIFESGPGWATLATLGLYVRPWMRIDYPEQPASIGRIESAAFDPLKWKPEYPNPAFDNMRPDDAFWAARIVARFDEPRVRAIVGKARYSDPRATDFLTKTLMERRRKVLETWLNQVTPVVDAQLDAAGTLTFHNAAVDAGVAAAPERYTATWFRFDNAASARTDVGDPATTPPGPITLPASLAGEAFVGVTLAATHPAHPGWARGATFYFRKVPAGWDTVGVER